MGRYSFLLNILFICFFIFQVSAQEKSYVEISSEEEALFLRRIAEFWEEGEYEIVKSQIEKYLEEYDKTSFWNYLHALLGDLYLKDKDYDKALSSYDSIEDKQVKDKIFLNYIRALYELEHYSTLCEKCSCFLEEKAALEDKTREEIYCYLGLSYYMQAVNSTKDEQKEFAAKAKLYFTQLLDSTYKFETIEKLASVQCMLEDAKSAAELYFDLAKEKKREDFLFQAAILQTQFDKIGAIKTFEDICKRGGSFSKVAAYNKMLLLFEAERYSQLIKEKDRFYKLVSRDKVKLVDFFIGKSHFLLEEYDQAKNYLQKFLHKETKATLEVKSALVMLMQSAVYLQDLSLLEGVFERYTKDYREDKQYMSFLFSRGILYKKCEDYEKAQIDFEKVDMEVFSAEEKANFLLEYAHLLYLRADWENSRLQFKRLLEFCPDTKKRDIAFPYFINASINLAEKNHSLVLKRQLLGDLENFLEYREEEEFLFLKGRLLYELKDYKKAIEQLHYLMNKFPFYPHLAQLHFILALSFKELGELKEFCIHGEKALLLDAELSNEGNLHLSLFNAYVKLGETNKDRALTAFAAEHLLRAFQIGANISSENFMWLIDHYYEKAEKSKQKQLMDTTIFLLEKKIPKKIEEETLLWEPYVIKLAKLYGYIGQYEREIELLQQLIKSYKQTPTLNFTSMQEAYFQLAKRYKYLEDNKKALMCFEEVAKTKNNSYYQLASQLYSARIRLSSIKNLSQEDVKDELIRLKTLALQKRWENEPVHLEAALDYINLRCRLLGEEPKKRLFLLSKAKKSFLSDKDVLSKDYHKKRQIMPEKEKMFQAYLKLLDIEILLVKGKIAQKEHLKEKNSYLQKVDDLMGALKGENITSYMQSRLQEIAKELATE